MRHIDPSLAKVAQREGTSEPSPVGEEASPVGEEASPVGEEAARHIEGFVRDRFQIAGDDPLFSRQVNLWEEGYVDSMGVVEVIEFLERHFAVKLPEEVIFSPDFTNIDGIARCVVSLKAA